MTTLDRETIEEAARGILSAFKRGQDDGPISEAAAGLRDQYEHVVEALQTHYGHTRQTAREEIVDFLTELEAIDPALPDIVADAANEMTGRKGRRGLTVVVAVLGLLLAAATLLWWRNPGAYRSLIDTISEATRE